MKIRRGFVTNSSSSSFIFKSTVDEVFTIEKVRDIFIEECKNLASGINNIGKYSIHNREDYEALLVELEAERGTNDILGMVAIDLNQISPEELLNYLDDFDCEEIIDWYGCCPVIKEIGYYNLNSIAFNNEEEQKRVILDLVKGFANPTCLNYHGCLIGEEANKDSYIPTNYICPAQELYRTVVKKYIEADEFDVKACLEEIEAVGENYRDRLLLLGDIILFKDTEFYYWELSEAVKKHARFGCSHMG